MVSQASHGLTFLGNGCSRKIIQALGFDDSQGHAPVQDAVASQVDPFLAALAQELLDLVTAIGEGRRIRSLAIMGKW